MSIKYCNRCLTPVQMSIFECTNCEGSSFVHNAPDPSFCLCKSPRVKDSHCVTCGNDIEPMRLSFLTHKSPERGSASTERVANPAKVAQQNLKEVVTELAISESMLDKKDIQAMIRAQNRTTHAVRAFVRFLFIQLTSSTAAFVLWNMGNSLNENGFFYFLSSIVLIGGIFWSSYAGWSELAKSDIE